MTTGYGFYPIFNYCEFHKYNRLASQKAFMSP